VPTDQHDMLGHKETKCSGSSFSALHSLHEESPGSVWSLQMYFPSKDNSKRDAMWELNSVSGAVLTMLARVCHIKFGPP